MDRMEAVEGQVVHLAGPLVTVIGRFMRQRCSWCGAVLIEYDLERTMAVVGDDGSVAGPSGWAEGEFVAQVGSFPKASWTVGFDPDVNRLSEVEGLCMNLDPAVTV